MLSLKKQNEILLWEYFMPKNVNWKPKTDKDIDMFFEWSEQGNHKERILTGDFSYFEGLRQGKRWAGIHVHEMYEQGILDGSVPYFTLLGIIEKPIPRYVVNFLKKEMFKGQDSNLIEEIYTSIS